MDTLRGKRNHAILAMLIGCGLRRGELLALNSLNSIQVREEHWVIADLTRKGGHIPTAPIPAWVKTAVDAWTTATGITAGSVFRSINKAVKAWGDGESQLDLAPSQINQECGAAACARDLVHCCDYVQWELH